VRESVSASVSVTHSLTHSVSQSGSHLRALYHTIQGVHVSVIKRIRPQSPYRLFQSPGSGYTIHHTPCTIHRTPYTIHHTPCTIYHIPYTIYGKIRYTIYTIYDIRCTIYLGAEVYEHHSLSSLGGCGGVPGLGCRV